MDEAMTTSGLGWLRAANERRQAEWDQDNRIDLAYRGCELAGEAGEAANVCKKLERERRGIRGSRASLQDLADELADVVICADLIAMGEGIDLGAAIIAKFNATSEKNNLATRIADALSIRAASPSPAPGDPVSAIVAGLRRRAEMHLKIARERPEVDGRMDDLAREHRMIAMRAGQDADYVESGDWKAPATSDKGDDRAVS